MPPRELTMPKLSDSMADAVILRWLKSAGEAFARGEGLIEVETDKATVDLRGRVGRDARLDPRPGGRDRGRRRADRDACERRRRGRPRRTPCASAARAGGSAARCDPGRRGAARCRRISSGASRRDAGGAADRGRARRLPPRPHRHRPGRPDHRRRRDASGGRGGDDLGSSRRKRRSPARARSASTSRRRRRRRSRAGWSSRRRRFRSSPSRPISTCRRSSRRGGRRAREARRLRRSTTSWSRRLLPRCASSRASTPPTSTARSSATHGSTSVSRSPPTTRCSCRSCATPTGSRWPSSPSETRALADGARRRALETRGPPRRHVHGLESRHVRRARVHRDHRSAAGRDPRRRRCPARARARKAPTASPSATC